MSDKIKPGRIADGYAITTHFDLPGFERVTVVHRPVTRLMWREHYKSVEGLSDAKKATARDEFLIGRIQSWSLDLPVSVESFDNLYPDILAAAILDHLYGGSTQDVEASLGN